MKKKVGRVTFEERTEIMTLFERRNGLAELSKVLTSENADLYEKVIKDMGETTMKSQMWWNNMEKKYQWEASDNGYWEINFETCDIYLVTD